MGLLEGSNNKEHFSLFLLLTIILFFKAFFAISPGDLRLSVITSLGCELQHFDTKKKKKNQTNKPAAAFIFGWQTNLQFNTADLEKIKTFPILKSKGP